MNTLTRSDFGVFLLKTETGSRYKLDLQPDKKVMVRIPDAVTGGTLRRDEEEIPILTFSPINVGEPARFALAPLTPGNGADATVRMTSCVTSVELLS